MNEAPAVDQASEDADTRIAPDPFTVVLPALSALGAVASIAAVNWVAQERTAERARSKRKVVVILRDLEKCCFGLQEIFRRFHKAKKLFAGEGPAVSSPLKFGVHGTRVGPAAIRTYHQAMNDVAAQQVPFEKLSVFFPMWNEEDYIERAVSFARRACTDLVERGDIVDYELIIVDDCSTDRTPELADAIAEAETLAEGATR